MTTSLSPGSGVMPTSGTCCTHVPSGLPGVSPRAENCSVRKATVFVSPSEPGARPSNSSEASVSVAAINVSARMPAAISAGGAPAPGSVGSLLRRATAARGRRDEG